MGNWAVHYITHGILITENFGAKSLFSCIEISFSYMKMKFSCMKFLCHDFCTHETFRTWFGNIGRSILTIIQITLN